MEEKKSILISGPFLQVSPVERTYIQSLYPALADVATDMFGKRGFVPHEHLGMTLTEFQALPINNPKRAEVIQKIDLLKREQFQSRTNFLVLVAIWQTWARAGIDQELALIHHVPVVILSPRGTVISSEILNHLTYASKDVLFFDDQEHASKLLQAELRRRHFGERRRVARSA